MLGYQQSSSQKRNLYLVYMTFDMRIFMVLCWLIFQGKFLFLTLKLGGDILLLRARNPVYDANVALFCSL